MGKPGTPSSDSTTRRDVPFWLHPQTYGMLEEWFQFYAPGTTHGIGPDGRWHFELGDPREYQGPDLPEFQFGDTTGAAMGMGIEQAKGGNPYSQPAEDYATSQLSGPMNNLAEQQMAYTMGGPLAGATRTGLLEELAGSPQRFSRQSMLDSLYGHTANRAQDNIYNMLMGDRAMSRQGAYDTQYGALANTARDASMATASGAMLNGNPFIDDQFRAASSAMADAYRDGVAPQTDAMFAQAGSFGGSAHQNLQAQQRYDFGRNLSDLAAQMYGQSYETERGHQENALNRERGFSQGMLSDELARQYQASEGMMDRRQAMTLAERAGFNNLLGGERGNQISAANSQLQRGASILPYLPSLRAADYIDINALMQMGAQQDQVNFQNAMTGYQNDLNKWEYLENNLRYLAQGLAPIIQATGYQQSEEHGSTRQPAPWTHGTSFDQLQPEMSKGSGSGEGTMGGRRKPSTGGFF